MVARDIPSGIDTTGRIRADDFVRGVIDSRGDHDWYRVELDPGRYVIRLSGTGDRPVGDPLLVVRDENGVETKRNDDEVPGIGSSRVEIKVTGESQTFYLDARSLGPYPVLGGIGHATGDYGLSVNRLDGTPLDAIAGGEWRTDGVVDVYFARAGERAKIYEGTETVVSSGWSDYEIRRAMAALESYSDVCDIGFRQTHRRERAEFTLVMDWDQNSRGGAAFQPPGTIGEGTGVFRAGPLVVAQDYWALRPGGGLEVGTRGWEVLVHEFGHGLGLAHPHDQGFGSVRMEGVRRWWHPGDFELNDVRFTVMSYREAGVPQYGNATGPMALDIAVLQERYGTTRSHHGDDSYLLPDRNILGTGYSCLWDTGGEDTIRAGRTDRDCTINLNAATLAYEPGGGGFLSSARGVNGGFTIANGVVLENAAGSAGDDFLVGNEAANRLAGGAGADVLRGRGGADRLHAGDDNARDLFVYRARTDSGPAWAEADRIAGFDVRSSRRETTWDRIDLRDLDGDADRPGDQPLRFVRAFSEPDPREPAGQVRAERHGDDTHVLIDLDGDDALDMRLILLDTDRVRADDFML